MKYVYVVEKAHDGSFSAYVPDLPGCTTCGDTPDDVRKDIKEAVSLYIDSIKCAGERVPLPTSVTDVVDEA